MPSVDLILPEREGKVRFIWGFYVSEELFNDADSEEAVVKIVREDVAMAAEKGVRESFRKRHEG